MFNGLLVVYLMSLLNDLNTAIDRVMDHLPDELAIENPQICGGSVKTYPVLDPILEFKESLYEQLEALQKNQKP